MNEIIINNDKIDLLRSLFDAIDFAAYKHRYQKRKGLRPVPYINHPLAVTKFLIDRVANPTFDMLQSAILHDTLEDTKTTFKELTDKFGSNVATIVKELTDDMSLPYNIRKKHQVEHASSLSYDAGCVKIADKYCNICDILNTHIGWPKIRKIQYVEWAIQVVANIQNKNQELEMAFYQLIETASKNLRTEFELK
jgi:(p)ppGpp synthase/HD superfamily hydrolase